MAKIPIILEPGRADGKLVTSSSIFDEDKGMFQSEINDIQNTLNSNDPNKPLSANQGKVLKELLDAKVIEVGAIPLDSEPTEDNTTHTVTSDGINKALLKRDEKLSELERDTVIYNMMTDVSIEPDTNGYINYSISPKIKAGTTIWIHNKSSVDLVLRSNGTVLAYINKNDITKVYSENELINVTLTKSNVQAPINIKYQLLYDSYEKREIVSLDNRLTTVAENLENTIEDEISEVKYGKELTYIVPDNGYIEINLGTFDKGANLVIKYQSNIKNKALILRKNDYSQENIIISEYLDNTEFQYSIEETQTLMLTRAAGVYTSGDTIKVSIKYNLGVNDSVYKDSFDLELGVFASLNLKMPLAYQYVDITVDDPEGCSDSFVVRGPDDSQVYGYAVSNYTSSIFVPDDVKYIRLTRAGSGIVHSGKINVTLKKTERLIDEGIRLLNSVAEGNAPYKDKHNNRQNTINTSEYVYVEYDKNGNKLFAINEEGKYVFFSGLIINRKCMMDIDGNTYSIGVKEENGVKYLIIE